MVKPTRIVYTLTRLIQNSSAAESPIERGWGLARQIDDIDSGTSERQARRIF